jgi:hypothetical protein
MAISVRPSTESAAFFSAIHPRDEALAALRDFAHCCGAPDMSKTLRTSTKEK